MSSLDTAPRIEEHEQVPIPIYSGSYYEQPTHPEEAITRRTVEIYARDDGEYLVMATATPVDHMPADDHDPHGQPKFENEVQRVYRNCETAYNLSQTELAPTLGLLGITVDAETTPQRTTIFATLPNDETLEAGLDEVRRYTGFAPHIRSVEGDQFTLGTMEESLKHEYVDIATDPATRAHDILAHLPAWLALPRSGFRGIAAKLHELADLRDQHTPGSAGAKRAQGTMKQYLLALDLQVINTVMMVETIHQVLQGLDYAPGQLKRQVALMQGSADDSKNNKEAQKIMTRIYQLRELDHKTKNHPANSRVVL